MQKRKITNVKKYSANSKAFAPLLTQRYPETSSLHLAGAGEWRAESCDSLHLPKSHMKGQMAFFLGGVEVKGPQDWLSDSHAGPLSGRKHPTPWEYCAKARAWLRSTLTSKVSKILTLRLFNLEKCHCFAYFVQIHPPRP